MDPRFVRLSAGGFLVVALAFPARAAAEDERLVLSVEARVGTATAPYVTRFFPEVSGYGVALQAFAFWRPASLVGLWFRAPYALMRVEQPAGAFYDEAAFGNPELGVRVERPLLAVDASDGRAGLDFSIGLPLAEHDSRDSQLEGRALTLANAFSGLSEPELYTPGVVALTPSAFATLRWSRLSLRGALKIPLLARVSRASLPSDANARSFGMASVVEVAGTVSPLTWLSLSLAPRLTVRERAVVTDGAGPANFLVSGVVGVAPSKGFSAALSAHVPVAGSLRSTLAGGLLLEAKF
ncbi:MAG TPA: hypothetical protein VFQ35_06520 [Polyangiaceae bacterium]|nr:hypothetical protein [Polyangiaceae bacterium]